MLLTKARPDWQAVVSEKLSRVQALVHLAVRYDKTQTDAIRAELTKARQRAYNDELSIQARRAGCSRQGEMTGGPALSELDQASKDDAEAFANQYNADLAGAIIQIGSDTPTANRHTYAARLREWEGQRAEAKAGPLAGWAENTARSLAQQDFHGNNKLEGSAHLEPAEAKCPVCAGWVARGDVRLRVAMNNPGVFHFGCPHGWVTDPEKISADECGELWMG